MINFLEYKKESILEIESCGGKYGEVLQKCFSEIHWQTSNLELVRRKI